MKNKTEFTVHLNTKYGLGLEKKKCYLGETAEETFMNAWRSLTKKQDENWFSITWEQDGKEFQIDRELLRENRFCFDLTVEETELT